MSAMLYTVLAASGGFVNGAAVSIGSEVALSEVEARYELALGSIASTGREPVLPIVPVLRPSDTVATRRDNLERPVPVASIETYLVREGGMIDAALAERGAEIVADAEGVVAGAAVAVRRALRADIDAKQDASPKLAALAALALVADRLLYATGGDGFGTAALTEFGRSILAGADARAVREVLQLGTAAQSASNAFALAAHTHGLAGVTGLQEALDGKQAASSKLSALAALTWAANKLIYATGAGTLATADLTPFARTILDDGDGPAVRGTLGLGSAALANVGTGAGMVPVLDANSKILSSLLPALAITDTFEVASQAEMLALATAQAGDARLPAERGDIAVRSDINRCFILKTEPASVLSNWVELKTPLDAVLSVAGLTGVVTAAQLRLALALTISDVTGLQGALDGKQAAHANLAALAGLSLAANKLIYSTGGGALAVADLTAFARTVLAAADAASARAALGVGQVIGGNSGSAVLPSGSTRYFAAGLSGGDPNNVWAVVGRAGRFRNLRIITQAAAGAGESWEFTLINLTTATALKCTISGSGGNTGSDLVNVANFNAGDRWSIRVVASANAPAHANVAFSLVFEPTD